MITKEMVRENATSYPQRFKMNLREDSFPWFLLSVLFGARITESIAVRTFFLFKTENLTSPEAIIEAGFDELVGVLDSGGYTRYDFRTATKLIEMSQSIIDQGGLVKIHNDAVDFDDLVNRLKTLAKGIGDVTVGIFLREMVGVWVKAKPYPSGLVVQASNFLKIDPYTFYKEIGVSYGELESFLVKVGKKCVRSRSGKTSAFCKELMQ